ncbi:uncharacterized protein LOC128395289 [Panonychus citri]|uniref:uncharacterized protein LOC128395289 n=1 Tax=Panonychus citri TaxID=50023 RepID=UPI0023080D63|nr:uncharacterized protein LOC128395289 [Panonychus citri]
MDKGKSSNGQPIGFIDNTHHDLTGEQLKTIRQLVKTLKVKDDGAKSRNQFIHQLYNDWSKLSLLCEQISTSAVNYDHIGIHDNQIVKATPLNDDNNNYHGNKVSQYNGVKSLIKVVSKFVYHVESGLKKDDGKSIDFEPLIQITEMLTHLIEIVSRIFIPGQSIGTGKHATLYLLDTYLESRDKITNGIKAYWSSYPAFWLDEDSQWLSSVFSLASSSLSNLPYSLMSLVSRSAHGHWQEDLLHSANPYFPLNLVNYLNNPLTSSINWLSCKYHGLHVREILVDNRQTEWHIPFDEEDGDGKVKFIPADVSTGDKLKPLKCRLIHQAGAKPNGNIILHAQGGAFTVELPSVFDQCFRVWTPQLEGAVILDVVYSRYVRYPVQVQELLDVFLWLTNYQTNDVESILGFIPKKIIFCGDSAGGLFFFSLATIIRDIQILSSSPSSSYSLINTKKPFPDHLYPKALVTFYPVLSITFPTVQPSLILSFLDQFLTPLTILNCLSLYSSGVIFDSECTNLDSPDASRYLQPDRWQAFYNTWMGKRKNWLECDKETLDERVEKISEAALTPYKAPLISYDLDLIKDLNIYLVVGEFDPFLDTNIEFAQRWPGKIKLDVIDDLGHGFLALSWSSPRCRRAARVCLNRILEAFNE